MRREHPLNWLCGFSIFLFFFSQTICSFNICCRKLRRRGVPRATSYIFVLAFFQRIHQSCFGSDKKSQVTTWPEDDNGIIFIFLNIVFPFLQISVTALISPHEVYQEKRRGRTVKNNFLSFFFF